MKKGLNQKALTYMTYLRGLGLNNHQISLKVGCMVETVRNYIGPTPEWTKKKYSKEQMLELRKSGLNNRQIAVKVGCAYGTVGNYIGPTPGRSNRPVWDVPDFLPGMEPKKNETETEPKNDNTGEFIISVKKVG